MVKGTYNFNTVVPEKKLGNWKLLLYTKWIHNWLALP